MLEDIRMRSCCYLANKTINCFGPVGMRAGSVLFCSIALLSLHYLYANMHTWSPEQLSIAHPLSVCVGRCRLPAALFHLAVSSSTLYRLQLTHISRCTVPYTVLYTGCPRRNVPDFGRVFLMLKYTDIIQNTYVQS